MTAYTSHEITPRERVEIKRNRIVLWNIESSSGYTYRVTVFEGHVTCCQRADGSACPGWRARHTCHHASLAQVREDAYRATHTAARTQELPHMPALHNSRPLTIEWGVPMR